MIYKGLGGICNHAFLFKVIRKYKYRVGLGCSGWLLLLLVMSFQPIFTTLNPIFSYCTFCDPEGAFQFLAFFWSIRAERWNNSKSGNFHLSPLPCPAGAFFLCSPIAPWLRKRASAFLIPCLPHRPHALRLVVSSCRSLWCKLCPAMIWAIALRCKMASPCSPPSPCAFLSNCRFLQGFTPSLLGFPATLPPYIITFTYTYTPLYSLV